MTDIKIVNQDNLEYSIKKLNGLKANLESPEFTGEPKAPTPQGGDNSTKIATTEFVTNATKVYYLNLEAMDLTKAVLTPIITNVHDLLTCIATDETELKNIVSSCCEFGDSLPALQDMYNAYRKNVPAIKAESRIIEPTNVEMFDDAMYVTLSLNAISDDQSGLTYSNQDVTLIFTKNSEGILNSIELRNDMYAGTSNSRLEQKANVDSPEFTGEPTAPTPETSDVSTRVATTEYVKGVVAELPSSSGMTDAMKKANLKYYRYLEGTSATKEYALDLRKATLQMEDFAKLGSGLFIHWGVYSALAGCYNGEKVETASDAVKAKTTTNYNAEWILRDLGIPLDIYKNYEQQFTGEKFDAGAIADMAVDCGMKYIIITAKHHEGFSLYPTNYGNWDIRESACRTTVLDELKEACDARGLKFGVYYSQYWDWMSPGGYGLNHGSKWTSTDPYTSAQHQTYIESVGNQLDELVNRYEPYILWYDPGTNYTDGCLNTLREVESKKYPHVITNDRLAYGRTYGDYGTGERTIYVKDGGSRNLEYGESCFTLNDTWGYSTNNETDSKYYTLEKIFKEFWLYTIAQGQNCLMNIGPKGDGSLSDKTMTRWAGMKTFIQNYCQGGFYNYSKMWTNTRPSWGYQIGFPNNSVHCYVVSGTNNLATETILDGVDTTGLDADNPVEILTPGTNASYEILDNYRIKITNLALEPNVKMGIVRLNYVSKPTALDAIAAVAGYKINLGTFSPNYALKSNFNVIGRYWALAKGKTLPSTPTMLWCDDDMYCSLNLDVNYSDNQAGSYITEVTVTDLLDSTKSTKFTINCTSRNANIKDSTEIMHFEKGHKYSISYSTSSSSTDTQTSIHKALTFVKNESAAVTGVTITPTSGTSANDQVSEYSITILPANAGNKNFTATVDDASVTVVTDVNNAKVTLSATGYADVDAILTVTTEEGSFTNTAEFHYRPVHPTSVTLNKTTIDLPANTEDALELVATVTPDNSANKNVTWSSDNTLAATVSSTGIVNTLGAGTANITATTVDGSLTATCVVNVIEEDIVNVNNITLDSTTLDMMECEVVQVNATISPENATFQGIAWSSDNDNVIVKKSDTDDKLAYITVKEGFAGTATVTATSADPAHPTATVTVNSVLETQDYKFEVASLDGLATNSDYQDTNIYPLNDDELNWTIFSWANGSVNPSTALGVDTTTGGDTNATLWQCVRNQSSWYGMRVDADNNTTKVSSGNPAGLRPRINMTAEFYANPITKATGGSGINVASPTASDVVHPFYFSRQTPEGGIWSDSTYWYSFDGINWNQYTHSNSGINNLRTINAPLTVGFDYKRSSGALTTTRYRFLKTVGLPDERVIVSYSRQPKYKFSKSLAKYDKDIKAEYESLALNTLATE